eukprot:COSAG01_NODE_7485_length_3190_cov_2.884180_4_plen_149_part_00
MLRLYCGACAWLSQRTHGNGHGVQVITSGTGGTGFIGVQLAKALGAARVVTATSGAANIALAKQLGADVVIDYKEQDIFDALPDDSVVRPGSPVKSLVRPLVLKRRGRTWCTIITAPKVAPIRRCERSGRGVSSLCCLAETAGACPSE